MFDIGWGKLVVIALIALVVIGPKELPAVLRTVGQWMGKIRRMAAEFQGQFQEAMRETEMADMKKQVDAIADATRDIGSNLNPLETTRKEIESLMGDTPTAASAPAPYASAAEPTSASEPQAAAAPAIEPQPQLPFP